MKMQDTIDRLKQVYLDGQTAEAEAERHHAIARMWDNAFKYGTCACILAGDIQDISNMEFLIDNGKEHIRIPLRKAPKFIRQYHFGMTIINNPHSEQAVAKKLWDSKLV